jgi:hypothetical protein
LTRRMFSLLLLVLVLVLAFAVPMHAQTSEVTEIRSVNSLVGLPCDASRGLLVRLNSDQNIYSCTSTGWQQVGSSGNQCGPSPWIDARCYGARTLALPAQTTTATTTAGSGTVKLVAAKDFINGDGITIYRAGTMTTQTTPAAPRVTSPPIQGRVTHNFKCVGVDSLGGLTAASEAGSVINAPSIFGKPPVQISSISQSSGVVTVAFSAMINATGGNVQMILITGVTGAGTPFNGYYPIATAPNSSQITYSLAGNAGAGTVSATSFGRLTNTQRIASIHRDIDGSIHIATSVDHNFVVQASPAHTIAIIDGASPFDLNGEYILSTASGNTMTMESALLRTATEIGSGQGTVTVYEYEDVTCPAYTGTTAAYYVYGDNGTGTYALIGKTILRNQTFRYWGPWLSAAGLNAGAFTAPSYVPSTPPVAAQNQMYVGKITAGAGSLNLTVSPVVPTSVAGAVAQHDNSVAFAAAGAVGTANSGGGIFLPPHAATSYFGSYVLTAPLTIPYNVGMMIGAPIVTSETIACGGFNVISTPFSGSNTGGTQFDTRSYEIIYGIASPLVACSGGSLEMSGVEFQVQNAYQIGLDMSSPYSWLHEVGFQGGNAVTDMPLLSIGLNTSNHLSNVQFAGYSNFQNIGSGQIFEGPMLGAWTIRSYDNFRGGPGSILLDGLNSFAGRGILVDVSQGNGGGYEFNFKEDQGPITPGVMLYGANSGYPLTMRGFMMDSSCIAAFANWDPGGGQEPVMEDISTSCGSPLVTGLPSPGLTIRRANNISTANIGQNQLMKVQMLSGTAVGGVNELKYIRTEMGGPTPPPIFFQFSAPTGVSAALAGAGTVPAGSPNFYVNAIGVNGLPTVLSVASPPITLDGSHAVTITWNPVSNVQGYEVWWNNPGVVTRLATNLTKTSFTLSTNPGCCSAAPTGLDLTGLPLIDSTQIASLLFKLVNGLFRVDFRAPTLTGNRTLTAADGQGSVIISGSLTTTVAARDNVAIQGVTASSHCQISARNASAATNYTTTYVSAVATNQVTVTHTATANMNYDIACTVN